MKTVRIKETLEIGHRRTRTHTSGRQLKIKFPDVLDYSEYSDTNDSKFFFHENSFLSEVVKSIKNLYVFGQTDK